MSTYLKDYYLDDRKLAQRALLEFHRALQSERMIAFTGAMTTEGFGYPDWNGLIDKFKAAAVEALLCSSPCSVCGHLLGSKEELTDKIESFFTHTKDKRVGLSLIGELADQVDKRHRNLDKSQTSRIELLEEALANLARKPESSSTDTDVISALWKDLGIQRFATLNYDLELEKMLMLTSEEQDEISPTKTIYETLENLAKKQHAGLDWRGRETGSGRIRRILPNGRTVESDMVSRERSDRLIDFAMGSIDAEQHIIHLHGRCDEPKSMVFSYRDYDKLYRRNDMHRQPFEYGHRIMTGGNPILFVGLGMGEAEINRTLEDFISNTPYHRTAPTFLFWNTRTLGEDKKTPKTMDENERAAFRMDKLHRLGVLTIFDTDVLGSTKIVELLDAKKGTSAPKLKNVETLVKNVAATAAIIGERENYTGKYWRNMGSKIEKDLKDISKLTKLWGVQLNKTEVEAHVKEEKDKLLVLLDRKESSLPLFVTASAGWGKGQLGSSLADDLGKTAVVLYANVGFCFDTDSFLDMAVRFLEQAAGATAKPNHPWRFTQENISRDSHFSNINLCGVDANLPQRTFCIVNGLDRFLDVHGLPLSAEFDRFIMQLLEDAKALPREGKWLLRQRNYVRFRQDKHIQWVFLGSDRTRLYLDRKSKDMAEQCGAKPETQYFRVQDFGNDHKKESSDEEQLASSYLQAIKNGMEDFKPSDAQGEAIKAANQQALNRSGESRRISIERLRRAFLDAYLETDALTKSGMDIKQAELAMEILRALAFIGLPVEAGVLCHVPRIFHKIDADGDGKLDDDERKQITEALAELKKRQLILEIEGFEDSTPPGVEPPKRYGLHRAIMAELRFRLGLPLSEAKLSTAFNMSLYVAQPVDGYIPEPDIHEELGDLIDSLIAAYKTEDSEPLRRAKKALGPIITDQNPPFGFALHNVDTVKNHFHRRGKSDYVACLRAALAVVRGYYSTTGLLTLDRTDRLIREDRDGILLEHAERLDNLIDAYGKTAKLRDDFRKGWQQTDQNKLSPRQKELRKKIRDEFESQYGLAEPFYADELVWLQNERGVVRLAMGDLHESNRSFQNALTVNKQYVEYGDRSHNWRRIKLNQMTIEIERGELLAAERMIREVLEASGWRVDAKAASMAEAEDIFKDCRNRKSANCGTSGAETGNTKHYFLQEDRLAIAVALGYRGMCANLRGEMLDAIDDLKLATELLRRLDEQRAFAYFTRLYAWALREVGKKKEGMRQIDLAIDAAQSTRQMDLVYRSGILRAQWDWESASATEKAKTVAARTLKNALDYGIAAEMQRVRTEAASALAKLKLSTGDYEVALQYTTEAMTIATRYNLKLRMMSVRVRLGEIMIRRGDEQTGRALIMGAIKAANRSGFQRVVDSGQQALDRLSSGS